eukprot:9261907-Alexandrium_andersonii.AAC.1
MGAGTRALARAAATASQGMRSKALERSSSAPQRGRVPSQSSVASSTEQPSLPHHWVPTGRGTLGRSALCQARRSTEPTEMGRESSPLGMPATRQDHKAAAS